MLLSLRLSGKLKNSALGASCLHDTRGPEYCSGDRRVARPDVGNKPLSNPTYSVFGAPDCMTHLELEPDEPPL